MATRGEELCIQRAERLKQPWSSIYILTRVVSVAEIGKNTKFFFVQTTFYYGEFSLLRASSAYNKTTDTKLQNLVELRINIRNINITRDTVDVGARESGMKVKDDVGVGVSVLCQVCPWGYMCTL